MDRVLVANFVIGFGLAAWILWPIVRDWATGRGAWKPKVCHVELYPTIRAGKAFVNLSAETLGAYQAGRVLNWDARFFLEGFDWTEEEDHFGVAWWSVTARYRVTHVG